MSMLETIAAMKIILLTTGSFLVALGWTPSWIRCLRRWRVGKSIRDAVTAPIMARLHAKKAGTPTMGGVLVWGTVLFLAVFFSAVAFFAPQHPLAFFHFISRSETLLPFGALLASAVVGLVDDYLDVRGKGVNGGGLRMRHRLFIYTIIAAFGAWWFFVKLDWDILHVPFAGDLALGGWYIPVFIFFLVATAFSVNQTDGLDGLAGGTLLSAFAAYGAIAFLQGRFDLASFCGVIIGALLAFLWNNIYPAKFFLGDTGAMSLGVTLGVVAMYTNEALLLPLIGLVFMLESLSTLAQWASKRWRKKKLFLSSPWHHHWEAKGLAEPTIVMRFWVVAGVASALGIVVAILDMALT